MPQEYGTAQPLMDYAKNLYGKVESIVGDPSAKPGEKKAAAKPQDSGKLPDEWEDANRKSAQQALDSEKIVGKKAVAKASKKRVAPVASKRVARKRS